MQITIQELHKYNSLVEEGLVPPILCPKDESHMRTLPWMDSDDKVCQKCFGCNTKIFLSQDAETAIKVLIYKYSISN